jgi:hypothetical protein
MFTKTYFQVGPSGADDGQLGSKEEKQFRIESVKKGRMHHY